jgi:hypothetical protein
LFLDAYRELNAKKMFWISLILTGLVMVLFSMLGVNDKTLTFLWMSPVKEIPGAKLLYKIIFSYVVVGVWLTWAAALLALISTAGIFPDFLSSGSIDLYLAKPIGRLRLFFTKYVAGLLFVALQVTLFALASFVVLGVRGGVWEPSLFLAIPLVLLFFSYLYSVCVLLGVLTRSTVAALLLTLLAWFGIFAVDYVDSKVAQYAKMLPMQHQRYAEMAEDAEDEVARLKALPPEQLKPEDLRRAEATRDLFAQRRDDDVQLSPTVVRTQQVLFGIKSVMPKTRETLNLLDRFLFTDQDLKDASRQQEVEAASAPTQPARRNARRGRSESAEEMATFMDPTRDRSAVWVLGTSVAFEALVLGVAAWVFVRRDY